MRQKTFGPIIMAEGFCYLTKRVTIGALHELGNKDLSPTENLKIFGKCYRTHGHSYSVEATVKGKIDPKSGLICDRDFFSDVLEREIVTRFNGTHLNSHFKSTSGEDLAKEFYELLKSKLKPLNLVSLRLQETPKNFFTVGEEAHLFT